MKRGSLITGTLWLTGAGLITRLLGFVYRIYLSNLIGSEGMGLYQLISPIYFLLFTLCSAGCHTAISQLVAAEHARQRRNTMRRILWICLIPAALLGLACSALVYFSAPWISAHILKDYRAAESIQILCLGLPFCISGSCLKAYFHGLRHMHVPAIEQVVEQLCRMGVIYWLSPLFSGSDVALTCRYVVFGTLIGDLISCLYTFAAYGLHRRKSRRLFLPSAINAAPFRKLIPSIWLIVLPVTGSRLLTQLLSSFENIMLPSVLQRSGLSSSAALSVYGEFGGMVMPLLTFPTIITGALSSNLLPLVAGAKAGGNLRRIHTAIHQSLRLTFMIAFLFTALFGALGLLMGHLIYPGTGAGSLLQLLSICCPFLYLQTTLGGILNGSGLQTHIFLYQLLSSGVRIIILLTLVPIHGFNTFLVGFFISLMVSTFLSLHKIVKTYRIKLQTLSTIVLPFLAALLTYLLLNLFLHYAPMHTAPSTLLFTLFSGSLLYFVLLIITKSITKKDLQEVLNLLKHNT